MTESKDYQPITGAAILMALVLGCSAVIGNAAEYRAFWVDGWGAGFLNQSQVDTLLGVPGTSTKGQIRDVNCNTVFIQGCNAFTACGSGSGI